MNPRERRVSATPSKASHPPVRRRGAPFFDALVDAIYDPASVRSALHQLVTEQYGEAERISGLRQWGGAQPYGNDRYQYSLEQQRRLSELIPGADLRRPSQSLLYRVGRAVIYPMRYGYSADDCPTDAKIDGTSDIQNRLAAGLYDETPTLFDPTPGEPLVVVWLLFTGNHVEGGPLSAYVALPGGRLADGRIHWPNIEELLANGGSGPPGAPGGQNPDDQEPDVPLPPEPALSMALRQ